MSSAPLSIVGMLRGSWTSKVAVGVLSPIIVCGIVFLASALVILAMTFVPTWSDQDQRDRFLSLYLDVSFYCGVTAGIGFLLASPLLHLWPSAKSQRYPYLWPIVSAAVSAVALVTGVTSATIGPFFGRLLPPAHFAKTDLFASVAAMS